MFLCITVTLGNVPLFFYTLHILYNRLGRVMIHVVGSSVELRVFNPSLVKPNT